MRQQAVPSARGMGQSEYHRLRIVNCLAMQDSYSSLFGPKICSADSRTFSRGRLVKERLNRHEIRGVLTSTSSSYGERTRMYLKVSCIFYWSTASPHTSLTQDLSTRPLSTFPLRARPFALVPSYQGVHCLPSLRCRIPLVAELPPANDPITTFAHATEGPTPDN